MNESAMPYEVLLERIVTAAKTITGIAQELPGRPAGGHTSVRSSPTRSPAGSPLVGRGLGGANARES